MTGEPYIGKLICEWIGAFFFWMTGGFQESYKDQLSDSRRNRNIWTGYFITIITGILIVCFYIRFGSR